MAKKSWQRSQPGWKSSSDVDSARRICGIVPRRMVQFAEQYPEEQIVAVLLRQLELGAGFACA